MLKGEVNLMQMVRILRSLTWNWFSADGCYSCDL